MEAELAVIQDLGYAIDRKAYFGYSVYGNNQTINNTHGFSARNAAGTAYTSAYSEVPLGIGLHVYGAGNTITQSANILTKGTGAAGIRVDGEKNTINVPQSTEIHADGKNFPPDTLSISILSILFFSLSILFSSSIFLVVFAFCSLYPRSRESVMFFYKWGIFTLTSLFEYTFYTFTKCIRYTGKTPFRLCIDKACSSA